MRRLVEEAAQVVLALMDRVVLVETVVLAHLLQLRA
jgi:hypothetical protein